MANRSRHSAPAPARTKRAVCRLAAITVRGTDFGVSLGPGMEVDLLATDGAGVTLEQLLGHYITGFELLDPQ